MRRILAKGQGWELTHETFPNASDKTILSLHSEFGTIEAVAKGIVVLGLFDSIEREYLRLSDLGPIEQTMIETQEDKPV